MWLVLLLFPVLLFSQQTCSVIDFKDSYMMQMNTPMDFSFGKSYLEITHLDYIYYYKIKKRIVKDNYSIYWVRNYKLYVYSEFILQKKFNNITIYMICNKKLRS